jgi:nucleotidyltransferase substrate binding protein (TIGR01987 family)
MNRDIRWIQRFDNYSQAFNTLSKDIELANSKELSDIEKRGLIQAFEYTYELAWNLIRDFYHSQGEVSIQGSRDAFCLAFNRGLIDNGDAFMQSVKARQLSVHTYNKKTADKIFSDIMNIYYPEFKKLFNKFSYLVQKQKLDTIDSANH